MVPRRQCSLEHFTQLGEEEAQKMRGHVRQRGRNWAIVIDQRDPHTGQRKRRWYSFKGTKRLAEVRCAELVAAAQQGSAIEPSRLTTAAFLARFDRDWATTHLSAQSRRRYGFALHHVEQHLGASRFRKFAPQTLRCSTRLWPVMGWLHAQSDWSIVCCVGRSDKPGSGVLSPLIRLSLPSRRR